MTDYDTDQARELRRARLTVVRPHNAPNSIGKAQFDATYKEQHVVVRETMTEVEETDHVMFCPACQEQMDDALVAARKLYVTYEEDPLRNYRALATMACKGCGWTEIVPIESPAALTADDVAVLREANSYRAKDQITQMQGTYAAPGISGLMGQSAQAQWNNQMRQQGMAAMLSQMYGAGPQALKSLHTGRIGNISGMNIHQMVAERPAPRRGQALADSIWQDYDSVAKQREQVVADRSFIETAKIREQVMKDAADAMAKSIDKDIMDQLAKQYAVKELEIRKPAPKPKYAVAPPPAPKPYTLDEHDKAEMRRQLEEAVVRADGDPTKLRKIYSQIKDFFR